VDLLNTADDMIEIVHIEITKERGLLEAGTL
jgi:hypothetical protein